MNLIKFPSQTADFPSTGLEFEDILRYCSIDIFMDIDSMTKFFGVLKSPRNEFVHNSNKKCRNFEEKPKKP